MFYPLVSVIIPVYQAEKFLTDYTIECMAKAEKAYWDLNAASIAKYINNR